MNYLAHDDAWAVDAVGVRYHFRVYGLDATVHGVEAVYAFCRRVGNTYPFLYIGRAKILSDRLAGHERRDEARASGARYLLVHIPGPADRVRYREAEARLIRRFDPPMNNHFRRFAAE
jgi:hypothetical protein